MKKTIFTIIMVSVTFLFTQNINAQISKWDGSSFSYSWYTNGSGATYHISTAADLAGLSQCFSNGYYKYGDFSGKTIILDNDIDLAGYEWTPIGSLTTDNVYTQFAGTFDGNNHTIKGLYISKLHGSSYSKYAGLFGYCPFANNLIIKNLKVEGIIKIVSCSSLGDYGKAAVGGILGAGVGTIENCSANVNITVDLSSKMCNEINVGGICGYDVNSSTVKFKKLSSAGSIYVSGTNDPDIQVGGIAGNVGGKNSVTSYLSSSCDITVSSGRMSFVGGIFGTSYSSKLNDAIFTGNLTVKYPNYGLVGGIAGQVPDNTSNCMMLGSYTKSGGTAYMSPITGAKSSSMNVSNSYYLSKLSNTNGFGVPKSESDFKSGIAFEGYDSKEWVFEAGKYPYLSFTSTVSRGDANGDSSVDYADMYITASYILGYNPDGFKANAANVNDDEAIDVADISGIANIIMNDSKVKTISDVKVSTKNAANSSTIGLLDELKGRSFTISDKVSTIVPGTWYVLHQKRYTGGYMYDDGAGSQIKISYNINPFDVENLTVEKGNYLVRFVEAKSSVGNPEYPTYYIQFGTGNYIGEQEGKSLGGGGVVPASVDNINNAKCWNVGQISNSELGHFWFNVDYMGKRIDNDQGAVVYWESGLIDHEHGDVPLQIDGNYDWSIYSIELSSTASVSIPNIEMAAGETKVIAINLDNPRKDYTGLQLDLYLPKGISILKEDDEYKIDFGSRTTYKKHSLESALQKDGAIRLLMYSAKNNTFSGESGDVVILTLKADDNLSAGAKTINLKNIVLSRADGSKAEPEDSKANITISLYDNIETIDATASDCNISIYSITGTKLSSPQKGINIIGGKKVLIQ